MAKESDNADDQRSIERELKRGSLELIVLHLLAAGEAYGYEIVSKLTAETNGALEMTDGTLYPLAVPPGACRVGDGALGTPRPRGAAQVLPADPRRTGRARAADPRMDDILEGDVEVAATK